MTTPKIKSYCKRLKENFKKDWLCKMDVQGGGWEGNVTLIATLQFFHDNMALQDSLLQWYRTLFVAFEAATFTLAYFLADKLGDTLFVFFPFGIGVVGCLAWWLVCTQRTNLAEKQRGEIERLVSYSRIDRWCDVYKGDHVYGPDKKKRKIARRIAQNIFNLVLPLVIFFLWILWICCI